MRILVAFAVLLLVGVTVFAINNPDPVTVRFLIWRQPTSLALAMIAAATAGALLVYVVSLAAQRGLKARLRAAESRLAEMERQRQAASSSGSPPASPARTT